MTAYRFRIKYDPDPTSLWRDIVVGHDRTLVEFQQAINAAMGLDQTHLWFFGRDEAYWDSEIKYQSPAEADNPASVDPLPFEETHDAAETTIADMGRQLGLAESDRICYLYDYGDEWRFYGILKQITHDQASDKPPAVTKEKGGGIEQYEPPGQNDQ